MVADLLLQPVAPMRARTERSLRNDMLGRIDGLPWIWGGVLGTEPECSITKCDACRRRSGVRSHSQHGLEQS